MSDETEVRRPSEGDSTATGAEVRTEDQFAERHAEEAAAPPATGAGTAGTAAAVGGSLRQASLWGDAWGELRRSPLFIACALVALTIVVMAVAPGLFTRTDPRACSLTDSLTPPGGGALFGYDLQGCDLYANVIYGARPSILIGFLAAGVATLFGAAVGAVAGYYGGWFDAVVARIADIVFAIPLILGGIVILSALPSRGVWQIALMLVLLGWPQIMRLMRSQVLSVKEADYVQAARALGASDGRILARHILPNAIAPVIVYATIYIGVVIGAEATLTFLGVGLQLPAISWGVLLSEAQARLLQAPHLLLFPGSFLVVTILAFLTMGDVLRDALDPRLR